MTETRRRANGRASYFECGATPATGEQPHPRNRTRSLAGALPATSNSRAHQPEWGSTRTVEQKVGLCVRDPLWVLADQWVFGVGYLLSNRQDAALPLLIGEHKIGRRVPGFTVINSGRFRTPMRAPPSPSNRSASLSADFQPGKVTSRRNALRDASGERRAPLTTIGRRGFGYTI